MNILIALIPALFWGINPLIIFKMGGHPDNQMIGTGVGTLIVGLIVNFSVAHASISAGTFWLSLISGSAWIIGQLGQYIGYQTIGVSRTMPLSTGLQLIGTSVIGVLMLGEWQSTLSKVVGFASIVLLIIGATMTSVTDKQEKGSHSATTGYITLIFTTIGYWIYSCLPKLTTASSLSIFFPQMLGMFLAAVIYVGIHNRRAFGERTSWLNVIPGLVYGVAALAYIFAAKANGVATAYVLAQLNVVISTLGGLLILHEHKTPRELRFTLGGLALIVVGSVVTAFL